ncbi:MAG: KamA family radical SAM protein [Verrucomicrobiota bacterium]
MKKGMGESSFAKATEDKWANGRMGERPRIRGISQSPIPPFPHSSSAFRRRFFPFASASDWNDWRWQVRNVIRDLAGLERILRLTDGERNAILRHKGSLPVGVTPYYASLLDPDVPLQPLRRTMVPVLAEFERRRGETDDPLGEEQHSPVPGLIHTYPDKVLFLVTSHCATYCRYCTRARLVGGGQALSNPRRWARAIEYIAETPAVRDVLISGGEPLLLSDGRLEWLLRRLRAVKHVELLRISTKVPACLPQRVTPSLVRLFRRHHPLWLSVHFTHPDELTPEAEKACCRLADGGIPMCSQTVLLKGVNDDTDTIKRLMLGLLRVRVKPYYLHQCDAITGSAHFRTPVRKGLEIIRSLHGFTTGYAVPQFMIDAPGGGGKVPVTPEYVVGRKGGRLLLRGFQGKVFSYNDE